MIVLIVALLVIPTEDTDIFRLIDSKVTPVYTYKRLKASR